jgi:hypothetical protein
LRVLTDADGIASCFWTLDEDDRHASQRVLAFLVDDGVTRSSVAFDAQLNRASLVAYTPGACVTLTNVRTVQDALDQLCQVGSGREPAIHVARVSVQNGSELANDTDIGVDAIAHGIAIQCVFDQRAGQALNPVSVNRATCYLALELPYPLSQTDRSMWQLTTGVLGFEPLVLAAQVSANAATIVWQPTDITANWLRTLLFDTVTRVTQIDRVLARLTLKGNSISSLPDAGNAPAFLDGDAFGSSGRERTAAMLPSGDGRRGGDFEMWFWLVQNAGLANLAVNPGVVVGGTSARVTISLTGPAPAAGTTIQVFVDGDPTGTIKVPDTVPVAAGGRDVSFDATTQPVGTSVSASIRVVMTTAGRTESRAVNLQVQAPVVDQLALNPTALDSGSVAVATLTLTGPAPAGGLPVRMATTDPNATAFPDAPSGTVVIAAGLSTIQVRVGTNPAIGNVTVTISATPSSDGRPAQANLTIRRLTLSGPTFNPAEVMLGNASIGTLTLSGVAPANGSVIDLAPPQRLALTDLQGNPISTVAVAAGSRTVTFRAVPEGSLSRAGLPVGATLRVGGASSSGSLVVSATLVSTVVLSTANVLGGTVVNATVNLNGPAPREGAVVGLSASPAIVGFRNAAGQNVGSVVVPAGASAVAFAVATPQLDAGDVQVTTIFAAIAGQGAASANLTIRGPAKSSSKDIKDARDSSGGGGGGKFQTIERQEPFLPTLPNLGGAEQAANVQPTEATGRAFISPEERPDVGAAALEQAAAAPPPEPEPEKKPRRARRPRKQSG